VLQRIGLAYFGAALLHAALPLRAQLGLIVAFLGVHGLLVAWVPVPGAGAPDVMVPGLNFASWFDPALLGRELVLVRTGPHPYDPEGLLPTLFACVPQALMGALVGDWLVRPGEPRAKVGRLALAGLGLALGGWAWSHGHPFIKSVWTSSYVLWTTGIAMVLLAGLHRWLDSRDGPGPAWVRVSRDFGVNALAAYIAHTLLLGLAASPIAFALYRALAGPLPPEVAALAPILLVLVLTYLPVRWMQARGLVLRV
jgi:predicted acyltransferase